MSTTQVSAVSTPNFHVAVEERQKKTSDSEGTVGISARVHGVSISAYLAHPTSHHHRMGSPINLNIHGEFVPGARPGSLPWRRKPVIPSGKNSTGSKVSRQLIRIYG